MCSDTLFPLRVKSGRAAAWSIAVVLLLATVAGGAEPVIPPLEDSGTTDFYQADADIVRLNDLKALGQLLEEFHQKTGRYPLEGKSELPLYVHIATPEQERRMFRSWSAAEKASYRHAVIPLAEFCTELESALGREVAIPCDPQRVAVNKPNFYLYMMYRGTYFLAIHVHHAFKFARQIGPYYYKVEISNRPSAERNIWDYRTLMDNRDFVAAAARQSAKPGYFKALRDVQDKEHRKLQAQALQGPIVSAFDPFDQQLGLGWDIGNPVASHWSLSKNPGTLTITTQAGTFTRERTDYKNLFLIDCPTALAQDFQITTCLVSFQPRALWNQAGLVLWNDENNFLTLVYEWGEGPPGLSLEHQGMFTLGVEVGGSAAFAWYRAAPQAAKLWLRIAKRMNRFELLSSADGEKFTPLEPVRDGRGPTDNMVYWDNGVVRRVGLVANNGSSTDAPQVDACFDFFEVKTLPVRPGARTSRGSP